MAGRVAEPRRQRRTLHGADRRGGVRQRVRTRHLQPWHRQGVRCRRAELLARHRADRRRRAPLRPSLSRASDVRVHVRRWQTQRDVPRRRPRPHVTRPRSGGSRMSASCERGARASERRRAAQATDGRRTARGGAFHLGADSQRLLHADRPRGASTALAQGCPDDRRVDHDDPQSRLRGLGGLLHAR